MHRLEVYFLDGHTEETELTKAGGSQFEFDYTTL